MEEITRNDFSYFQNEILKDMKSTENKLTDKISTLSINFENYKLIMDQKNEVFTAKIDELIKSLDYRIILEKVNNKLNKFNSKLEETTLINNTKIANFEKELRNACFKYDRIFLNNLSSPGLIGDGCPYPTMKTFFEYVNNKIKEMTSSKEKILIDFKAYENWVKSTLDKFKEEISEYKDNEHEFLVKEIKKYDQRSLEKMNMVEDKLNSIRLENGNYNLDLKKKWNELEEKLELFHTMNDNIINIYNKCRKEFIQIKTKFNDLSKYFKNLKLMSNGKGRTIFDEISKKINIDKIQKTNIENSKFNKILPTITSLEDSSNVFLNKNNNHHNTIQNFNIEIKDSHSQLFRKKSFKIESLTLSNIKNLNSENNEIKKNNLRQSLKNNILQNYKELYTDKNDFSPIEKKLTNKITLSKKNGNIYPNNFITEENGDIESKILDDDMSINDNNNNEHIKNSKSLISEDENKEKDIKEKIKDIELIKDKEMNSNSISKFETIEQKMSSTLKSKDINNKFSNEFNLNNNENSNIVTKINLDEELNKIKQKFDNLYEKANEKIINITHQINSLIGKINKSILMKENMKKIKEIDFSVEQKKKTLILTNSRITLPVSINHVKNVSSEKKDNNEKDISFNSLNKVKNRNLYNKKHLYNIVQINGPKFLEVRSNSNDLVNLVRNKGNNKNNDYYKIDKSSVNKLESYLIKKFSEPT